MTVDGEEKRDDGMGTWDKSSPFVEPTDPATARQKTGSDATVELRNSKELDVPPSSSHSEGSKLSEQRQAAESAKPPRRWSQRLNPFRWRQIPPVPTERTVSKEYGAGYLSLTGYLRPLEVQDIWLVNPDRSVDVLVVKLERSFQNCVRRGDRYPLLWAIYENFKVEFWVGGICALFSNLLQVMTPFTSRYLIQFAADAYLAKHAGKPGPQLGRGIGIVIGICFMQTCQSLGAAQFFYRGMIVGAQSRAVLINMIFSKALKLSGRAKAGGKATAESSENQGSKGTAEESESLRAARDGILKGRFQKKPGKANGPKVTPDAATGIAGDGVGWSNGRIITLMSVDVDRIDRALELFHLLWTSPILVVVALIVLVVNIGYSALSGYALLLTGLPFVTYSVRSLIRRRKKINKMTDERVSLTQEILTAVRFVKLFGWESSFLRRLNDIRQREIHAIQVILSIRNAILCVSLSLPGFASMLAFITYSLSNHVLSPAPIFSSLALFNALRMPLNMLPLVLGQVTDAWTALGRIQEFLLAEEQQADIQQDTSLAPAIKVEDASFAWERLPTDAAREADRKDEKRMRRCKEVNESTSPAQGNSTCDLPIEPFELKDFTFEIGRNELIAVIGTVGCGKSSLLSALAGEMRLTRGNVTMNATRAFCPQYAWIQNATAKDNILFGKRYDDVWYNKVVDACALRTDFDMLPAYDATEIGERGITVSGGQKQRLNIARGIYFDADVILMDDPLSAVDAHVGRHIMDNAICGLLKDKCRILATHQLHVLSRCDRIILMDGGRISSIDTFDNLMRDNEAFRQLLATTSQEEDTSKNGSDREDGIEAASVEMPKNKSKTSKPLALMQQEDRAVSSVDWEVWRAYIASFGLIINVTSLWLSFWTSDEFGLSTGQYIGVYAGLAGIQLCLIFAFSTTLSVSGTNASRVMFQKAMTRVLRAPMAFFDTTPMGRIVNRFSHDVHTMDNDLTETMRIYYLTLSLIISILILIIVFFHYFAVALGPLFILFLIAANYYRASAREMKRHEAVLRSTVFAQFSEGISGISSIRAYGVQAHFLRRLRAALDDMDSAYFLTFANQRWLSVRLDAIGIFMVFVTGILVVTSRFNVSPSISGLVLSHILAISQMLQFTIRCLADVENSMNATERIHHYGTKLEEEAPQHLLELDSQWPQQGRISFSNVEMRYRPGLPLVLQGLTMDIRGGEHIGIVGRTGAGKSTITSTLFRMTELSGGTIKIDDIDIATVGLHDLRSRLAIIPQDPALFHGTIRSNLDPFNEHTDLKLWSALRKADLVGQDTPSDSSTDQINSSPTARQPQQRINLDTVVEEEGLNFSLGQRQLMALARALVRDSRIIVCDEATSSVDFETDRKIQKTMSQGFKGKTLLCIAHRLRTVINYDRICVMDQGRIVEFDEPLKLWEKPGGVFRGMCDRSGILGEDFLVGFDE
ncbi:ABC protein [Histoplasma capsulatum G186AR]|uniref:ABC protein n=1 Tax=Ajellomyces capsulatus (strain G186AR / H82 / ATCC MYA-2454 / RMSCC 2432) TaxID=447093 RepID=C0NXH3_AJECG|nr:ABC protein [Histoplasma capsulatum G186AR]EEH04039.1 ABC protein [Histoplasma capsulatum G186AR]